MCVEWEARHTVHFVNGSCYEAFLKDSSFSHYFSRVPSDFRFISAPLHATLLVPSTSLEFPQGSHRGPWSFRIQQSHGTLPDHMPILGPPFPQGCLDPLPCLPISPPFPASDIGGSFFPPFFLASDIGGSFFLEPGWEELCAFCQYKEKVILLVSNYQVFKTMALPKADT